MNDLNYNDFKNICRTCMSNCDIKFYQDNVILDIFYKLTNIQYEMNSELPQQICLKCFEKINEINTFVFQCKRTHSILMTCLQNYKNQDLEIVEENNEVIEVKQELIKEETSELIDDIVYEIVKEDDNQFLEIKEELIDLSNNDEKIDVIHDKSDLKNNTSELIGTNIIKDPNITIEGNSVRDDDSDNLYNLKKMKKVRSDDLQIKYINIIKNTQTKNKSSHKCSMCPRQFNFRNTLITHERSHTDELPYECYECKKRFCTMSHLMQHKQIHARPPVTCPLCNKEFKSLRIFKTHVRRHDTNGNNKQVTKTLLSM